MYIKKVETIVPDLRTSDAIELYKRIKTIDNILCDIAKADELNFEPISEFKDLGTTLFDNADTLIKQLGYEIILEDDDKCTDIRINYRICNEIAGLIINIPYSQFELEEKLYDLALISLHVIELISEKISKNLYQWDNINNYSGICLIEASSLFGLLPIGSIFVIYIDGSSNIMVKISDSTAKFIANDSYIGGPTLSNDEKGYVDIDKEHKVYVLYSPKQDTDVEKEEQIPPISDKINNCPIELGNICIGDRKYSYYINAISIPFDDNFKRYMKYNIETGVATQDIFIERNSHKSLFALRDIIYSNMSNLNISNYNSDYIGNILITGFLSSTEDCDDTYTMSNFGCGYRKCINAKKSINLTITDSIDDYFNHFIIYADNFIDIKRYFDLHKNNNIKYIAILDKKLTNDNSNNFIIADKVYNIYKLVEDEE